MNQADAFLQDIIAHPEDDTPRLIFADWLEEQGGPRDRARAEFIRVQFALAGLPAGDLRRPPLEQRERDLLLAHEQEWTAGLRELDVWTWKFRRGFVEHIGIHPSRLVEQAEPLRALAPLRELHLLAHPPAGWTGTPGTCHLEIVTRLPWLEQITALDVDGALGRHPRIQGIAALLRSPRLVRLTDLALRHDAAVLDVLAGVPYLPRLKSLRIRDAHYDRRRGPFLAEANLSGLVRLELRGAGAAALRGLACSPHLGRLEELVLTGSSLADAIEHLAAVRAPRLRYLDLGNTRLSDTELRRLLRSPLIASLEVLDLTANPLGEPGAQHLAAAGLGRLRRLVANNTGLGPPGAGALACGGALPVLEALHLRTNTLGDRGLADLASGKLPRLRELNVSYNGITAAGLEALAGHWPDGLATLDLSWNRFGDAGVLALAHCPGLSSLTALDLSYCELGDPAARALAECPGLGNLATLNLGTNRIGDEGLAALARSPHLGALRSLHLGDTAVGDDGLRALHDSPLLNRLEVLVVGGSRVSAQARQELRSAYRGILG